MLAAGAALTAWLTIPDQTDPEDGSKKLASFSTHLYVTPSHGTRDNLVRHSSITDVRLSSDCFTRGRNVPAQTSLSTGITASMKLPSDAEASLWAGIF